MRVGDTQIIKIHLQRNRENTASGPADTADPIVTEALTVQLKAPADNFHIEPLRPETNWLDQKTRHIGDGAYGKWKWKVRPLKPGHTQLKLVVSARTLNEAGQLSEAVLPDQMIDIKVSSNLGKFIIMGAAATLVLGIGTSLFYFYPILKHLF